jgi:hypothetical protein
MSETIPETIRETILGEHGSDCWLMQLPQTRLVGRGRERTVYLEERMSFADMKCTCRLGKP